MLPWICYPRYVTLDMLPWICYPGYVTLDMLPWICYPGYVTLDMLPWICYPGYVDRNSSYNSSSLAGQASAISITVCYYKDVY